MKACTSNNKGERNLWHRKQQDFLRSHDICLKTIVLVNYDGRWANVKFVTFFLLNARVLESIKLKVYSSEELIEGFIVEQHRVLQMEKRASRGARLQITIKCGHPDTKIKNVEDRI